MTSALYVTVDEREAREVVRARRPRGRSPPRRRRARYARRSASTSSTSAGRCRIACQQRRAGRPARRAEVGLVDGTSTPPERARSPRRRRRRPRPSRATLTASSSSRSRNADTTPEPIGGRASRPSASPPTRAKNARGIGTQEAGAVAGDAVGGDRLTVAHARQPGQGELDDLAAGAAGRVRDEADAAGSRAQRCRWRGARCCDDRGRDRSRPTDGTPRSREGRCRLGDPTQERRRCRGTASDS